MALLRRCEWRLAPGNPGGEQAAGRRRPVSGGGLGGLGGLGAVPAPNASGWCHRAAARRAGRGRM